MSRGGDVVRSYVPHWVFWTMTAGSTVGSSLPHHTDMVWKHYHMEAEQTVHCHAGPAGVFSVHRCLGWMPVQIQGAAEAGTVLAGYLNSS